MNKEIKHRAVIIIVATFAIIIFGAVFFIYPAMAAEENIITTTSEQVVDTITDEQNIIMDELAQDENITEEELGATTPGTFYWLKNIGRTIQKAFTFNPVKKAEIDLTQASEQLLKAQELLDNSTDPEVQQRIEAAIEKYQQKINNIKARVDEIANENPEARERFNELFSDKQFKQQIILDKLESKLPEQAFAKVQQAKERTMAHWGEIMEKLTDNEEGIKQTIENTINNQTGSAFKDLKNSEILENLAANMNGNAKAIIKQVREKVITNFGEEIANAPVEIKNRLNAYLTNMNGDLVSRLKIVEELKNEIDDDKTSNDLDISKERLMEKFEVRLQNAQQQLTRERLLKNLADDDLVENTKIVNELKLKLNQEDAQKFQADLQNIKTRFMEQNKARIQENLDDETDDDNNGMQKIDREQNIGNQVARKRMELKEAKEIANRICTQGRLKDDAIFNANTNTWWIDMELEKPGCRPACVVNAETKQAEINWRCTGLIQPTDINDDENDENKNDDESDDELLPPTIERLQERARELENNRR